MKIAAIPAVAAALGLSVAGSEAKFNSASVPESMVYYYSQWAVYGGKPVPENKSNSSGGSYAGRFFYLDDFIAKSSNFYPSGTEKTINFSFGGIDMDSCKVVTVDFWADLMVGAGTELGRCGRKDAGWSGNDTSEDGGSDNMKTGLACSLRALKKKDPSYKVALSIGGWTMSSEFGRCARDATKRRALVDSLQYFVDNYSIDIVDIDWEYPSKAGCGGGMDDPCKMVISRKRNYQPNEKPESSQCEPGALYKLYDTLRNGGFPVVIEHIDRYDSIGQSVSTAENCSAYHAPNWGNIPSGAAGMAQYWAGSITNKDWVNYVSLLRDLSNKSYSKGKLRVSSAVGMDTCSSKGQLNGKQCERSAGYREYPAYPKGQGTSLKEFCDVQSQTGGHVNFMSYDFYGNWGAPYHNAPLYDNPNLRQHPDYLYEYNVDLSARNWLVQSEGGVQPENEGCKAKQVNIGLALYGRTYSKANGFAKFAPKASQQTLGVGSYQAGVVSVYDLRHRFLTKAQDGVCDTSAGQKWGNEHCGKWTLKRDVFAGCVPFLEKSNGNGTYEYVSYDDGYSLALKTKWARCMGFKGVLFWDAADDQDGVTSRAAWQGWQSVSQGECDKILKMSTSCPGAVGEMVCFGEPGDKCSGTAPEPEPQPPVVPGEPSEPEGGESCPDYKACVEGCLNILN